MWQSCFGVAEAEEDALWALILLSKAAQVIMEASLVACGRGALQCSCGLWWSGACMSGSELALGAQSCRNGDCANRERGLPQHRVVPHGQEKAWQFQVGAKRRLEQGLEEGS